MPILTSSHLLPVYFVMLFALLVKKAGTVIHMSMPAGLTCGLILFN